MIIIIISFIIKFTAASFYDRVSFINASMSTTFFFYYSIIIVFINIIIYYNNNNNNK
jgi:hypothetical protein